MEELFAIGHSNYSLESLFERVMVYGISCVVDICGIPYSAYNVHVDRGPLQKYLEDHGIQDIYMGEEVGANRVTMHAYNQDGYVDFSKVRQEE